MEVMTQTLECGNVSQLQKHIIQVRLDMHNEDCVWFIYQFLKFLICSLSPPQSYIFKSLSSLLDYANILVSTSTRII